MAKQKKIAKKQKAEEISDENEKQSCPACGSNNIVCSRADDNLICKDCGTIVPAGCGSEEELI